MMEGRDWMSLLVGLILTCFGALPLLSRFIDALEPYNFVEKVGIEVFAYVVAAMGFYLMMNSIVEITNSNSIGTLSLLVALVFLAVGLMQVIHRFWSGAPGFFEMGWITHTIYYVIFTIEGIFFMIAAFAMEL